MHTASGEVWLYKDKNGLLNIDLKESLEDAAARAFIQTVHQKYKGYTKRKILQAKEARHMMGMIENPSKGDFKNMVRGNTINSCPVIINAITNVRAIFVPDLASLSLRGKTVWRTPAPVIADYVTVPQEVVEQNKAVTMAVDLFFVDGTAFFLTISRQIKFIAAEHVSTCTAKSLSKHIISVIQVHARAGFNVHTILMDGEFEKVKEELLLLVCNTTAEKEHVSKAKRSIQTIKEHTRGMICTLPFTYIP
jgi:hypothetical protein